MSETQTSTHITQVGTVIVPVSDQDRAIEFYVEKLGFEKHADVPYGNGERWVEVAPAGVGQDGTTIALVPPHGGDPVGIRTHVGFGTDDAQAAHATLRERGVDVDEELVGGGDDPVPPLFFFRDQDGNTAMIVQRS
jgi:catechol 2,3-dioxygenase-like lactoylglutathione lyase family enzyme